MENNSDLVASAESQQGGLVGSQISNFWGADHLSILRGKNIISRDAYSHIIDVLNAPILDVRFSRGFPIEDKGDK